MPRETVTVPELVFQFKKAYRQLVLAECSREHIVETTKNQPNNQLSRVCFEKLQTEVAELEDKISALINQSL